MKYTQCVPKITELFGYRIRYTLWVQFRIAEFSDFLKTSYTYVFRRADYEYDSENERQDDFHGEAMKKP